MRFRVSLAERNGMEPISRRILIFRLPARLTIRSKGERNENSSFFPLRRRFEKTEAINSRFCSVFERSKISAAREATEISPSKVVR